MMNYTTKLLASYCLMALTIFHIGCGAAKHGAFKAKTVFESPELVIIQIGENSFKHISYKQTNDFGNVPCNGLLVRSNNEVIIFDTPTNDNSAETLIKWVNTTLHCKINAVIPTHFHDDCLGGLKAFHKNNIPSFANAKTIELAKAQNAAIPQNGFTDSLVLAVGKEKVIVRFLGEGHTRDNVVGYFPSEHTMFGGCLVKEIGAGKGFTGDANLTTWSGTVENVKKTFPEVKTVVPGHGEHGNIKLLDYTIQLFKTQ